MKIGVRVRVDKPVDPKISGICKGVKCTFPTLTGVLTSRHYIDQKPRIIVAGARSLADTYTLSKLEKCYVSGGWGWLEWTNNGSHKVWGCIPLYATSYPAPEISNPIGSGSYAVEDVNLTNGAVLKAYAILADTAVQASVSAAELPETIKLMRLTKIARFMKSPCRTVVNGLTEMSKDIKKARRGRTKGLWDTAKVASNYWLEYRLGLTPALMDFNNYRDLLIKGISDYNNGLHRVTKSVLGTKSVSRVGINYSNYANELYTWLTFSGIFTRTEQHKASCTLFYHKDDLSDLDKWRVQLGLTVGDIPGHIWETIPLSFVVDRFLDVSTWLKAWKVVPGLRVVDGLISYKKERTLSEFSVGPITGWSYKVPSLEPFELIRTQLERRNLPERTSQPLLNRKVLKLKQHLDHIGLTIQMIPGIFKNLARR